MKNIITLVALLTFSPVVNAFNLDSLLIKSVGGKPALKSLKEMKTYATWGEVTLNGQKGHFVQYFVTPDKYYLRVNFGNFEMIQAYNGKIAWQKDLNGQISYLKGFEKEELIKNIYFESYAYLFPQKKKGDIIYQGTIEKDGNSYHKVAFIPFENDTLFAYYSLTDSLKKMTTSHLDQISTITYVDDYRKVDNVLVPFYSKAVVKDASFSTTFVADSIVINQPVDTSLFEISTQPLQDFHFPNDVAKVDIPFIYRHGHIRLPVVINGKKKIWVILDSGASANIFNKTIIDSLHLPEVGTLPAMGISGFEDVVLVKTDSLQIGSLTLYNQVVGKMNLDAVTYHTNNAYNFGGVIGFDFLSRFPILINYSETTLTVYNPDNFPTPPGGVEIPFHLTMQVPTVHGEINGVDGEFLVDLGNAFGLIIHKQFAQKNNLETKLHNIKKNPQLFGGIGGAIAGENALADSFKIGDIMINSLRVLLPDSAQGITGSAKIAGNIGNLILSKFKILFDYPHGRLIFYKSGK